MNNVLIGVIMSVYKSDKAEFIKLSLDSMLHQDNVNVNIYLHIDGPVSSSINLLVDEYEKLSNVNVTRHEQNLGLATRLNQSVEQALADNVDFIARMDADDISFSDRFYHQVKYFELNPDVSVLGTSVIEINSLGEEIFYKSMVTDHKTLSENIIKKCPFNHPTVMFRTTIFEEGFRYKEKLINTQDYYLWVDLLANGKRFGNINEPLLYFRIDESFHSRRGFDKALNDCRSRLYAFKKLNNMSCSNLLHVVKLFLLRVAPKPIKLLAYKYFRS
ncbi:glycosyltransferase [Vibrio alfacsensis]|uniref:glycosyltransferase n=1 Tax=Vibrio alfacsensis TaxID=1074311 RepID=UPI00406868A6